MRYKLLILALLLLSVAHTAVAQTLNVEGTVVDSGNEPVIGASIYIKGTKTGTVTDINGKFTLKGLKASDVLQISYVGMVTQELKAKNRMTVVMENDAQALDEVLVVAFGKQKRSSFTGSAATIGEEALSKRLVTNALEAMQGEVAGVQMLTNSGDPTSEPTIRVRGFSSVNAGNDPLIILDGAPYDGGFNSINPNDVATLTVLKDAASNALYGARGANGVILITTKSAARGEAKTQISLDAKWGVNTEAIIDYDYITEPAAYYEMYYKALRDNNLNNGMSFYDAHVNANETLGLSSAQNGLGYIAYSVPNGERLIGENGKLNPNATLGNRIYNNGEFYTIMPDNWVDAAYKSTLRQEYNISTTTTTEKARMFASVGYLNNEGVAVHTGFERYTARIKADWNATKFLTIGGNVGYTHSKYSNLSDGGSGSVNIFYMLRRMAPIYPLYIRDGSGNIMTDSNGKMYDYGDGAVNGLARPELSQTNYIQESWLNTNKTDANQLTLTGFADIEPLPGLKLTLNGTVTNMWDKSAVTINPFYGYGASAFDNGYVSAMQSSELSLNFQQLLNYNFSVGKNNFNLLLGHESYKDTYDYVYGAKENMAAYFANQTLAGAITVYDTSDQHSDYNNEGYFFRAMYDYDDRYFGSVSYRRDASSRFHPDHRWGDFFSFGGAWMMTKEPWLQLSWLDQLKLKASFGQQGNDNIGDFRYTDQYTIVNSAGSLGIQYYSKGNKNITWETNSNFNAGVEFGLWKGRLTGSVEYFFRRTTDMLFFLSAPKSAGYAGSYYNVGDMDNYGIELDLTGYIIKNKHLTWSVNANATHFKNEIITLAEGIKNTTIATGERGRINESNGQILCEGQPLYTWCMPRYAGVSDEGLSQWYLADGSVTTDYSTASSAENRFICGTSIPDLYGGFGTRLSFKGLELSVNFNYSIGGKAYDYAYASMMTNPTTGSTGYNIHRDMYGAWSETNKDSNIPRFVFNDMNTSSRSDRFLTDASYLTLQNINLSYTLPKQWTMKARLSGVRVFAAAENIYYWSKRKGFDPRGSFSGITSTATYSPVRTISGGISITY